MLDALHHVPQVLQCLNMISDPALFKACAIPATAAMGTLALCYNNAGVFEGGYMSAPRNGSLVAGML